MKSFKSMLSVAALVVAGITAKAQTADDVINKHLDAVGGKDKLGQITSVVIEASVNAMGADNPATTTLLVGKGYRNEMEINGQKIVQVITDKGGWAINPFQGGTDAQAMPDDQYKGMESSIHVDPFYDYAVHGDKVELQGMDGDNYKILLTNKDNVATTYYVDKNTSYITKLTRSVNMMGNDMEVTFAFSDFKKNDFGTTTANAMQIDYGSAFSMTMTIKKVTVNAPVDPTIFDMPK